MRRRLALLIFFLNGMFCIPAGAAVVNDCNRLLIRDAYSTTVETGRDWLKKPFAAKAQEFVRSVFNSLKQTTVTAADFLTPWPTPVFNKKAKIFNKQLADFDYVPDQAELALLERTGSKNAFELRSRLLKVNPNASAFYRRGKQVYSMALGVLISLTAFQAIAMEENTVTFDTYLSQPLAVDDAQMIIETGAIPHSALRIGDRVYSYGVSDVSSQSVHEYLAQTRPQRVEVEPDSHLSKVTAHLADFVYDSRMADRSVRVVNLNLPREEVLRIRRELELSTAKTYLNRTGVNDCATMIARALERQTRLDLPYLVDAYPVTTGAYLALREQLGDKGVEGTQMVISTMDAKGRSLTRNSWIAFIEGKVMLALSAIQLPRRLYFDLTTHESEIEHYTPETAREIRDWKEEQNRELKTYFEEAGAGDQIEKLDSRKLNLILSAVIEPERQATLEILDEPTAEFRDLVIAESKLSLLDEKRRQIREILSSRK